MSRVAVGDIVLRFKHRSAKRKQYQVIGVRDKSLGPGVTDQRVHLFDEETGKSVGWCYSWDVQVIKSADRIELEQVRVSLARIALRLELGHRIPGQGSVDTKEGLRNRAQKYDKGWDDLVDACLRRINRLIILTERV